MLHIPTSIQALALVIDLGLHKDREKLSPEWDFKKEVEQRLLEFLDNNSYHLPLYAKPGMNDGIRHVESIFCVNTFLAPVTLPEEILYM